MLLHAFYIKKKQTTMVCLWVVEMMGVEPMSKNQFLQTSPSAVYLLKFPPSNIDKQIFESGSLKNTHYPTSFDSFGSTFNDALSHPSGQNG